jgi:hypothetical protein
MCDLAAPIIHTPAVCGIRSAFRRMNAHPSPPHIPILGTCITSPPSALFRARTSPHLQHFSGQGCLPDPSTRPTILIDAALLVPCTRIHLP